jgi:hypothetical protein
MQTVVGAVRGCSHAASAPSPGWAYCDPVMLLRPLSPRHSNLARDPDPAGMVQTRNSSSAGADKRSMRSVCSRSSAR